MNDNAEAAVVEQTTPEAIETSEVQEQPQEQVEQQEQPVEKSEPDKKLEHVERRISKLVRERELERTRAQQLEFELQQIKSKLDTTSKVDIDPEDERVMRIVEARLKQEKDAEQQRQVQTYKEEAKIKWEAKADKVLDKHPDYYEVMETSTAVVSPAMTEALYLLDNGPDVAYHLANNPAEAAEIYKLLPAQQVMRIHKLGIKLEGEVAPKTSAAPKPISPVTGAKTTATSVYDPNISVDEYIKQRNKQLGVK